LYNSPHWRVGFCASSSIVWENRPNCWLLQNEIEARKVNAVVTAVGDQKKFYKELKYYLLNKGK